LRARYYDPATGTFIARDPLTNVPNTKPHGFAYAAGNPVSLADPLGLKPWEETWCGFETCAGKDPSNCSWENLDSCDLDAGIYPRGTDGTGGWFREYNGVLQWCTIGWTGSYLSPLCGNALGGGISAFDKASAAAAKACLMSVGTSLTVGAVIRKFIGGRTWVGVVANCAAAAAGTLWFPEDTVTGKAN
jgi:hypothetical protein